MISIIICSKDKHMLSQLESNISETIGVPYEIISINNSNGFYGICEAYNLGGGLAKYKFLCFVHEDVLFRTKNWGVNIINHFTHDTRLGLIGIAGSKIKTKSLSSWWQSNIDDYQPNRENIIQHYKQTERDTEHFLLNPYNEILSEVVTLDGVFLVTKRNIWQYSKFDEHLLKGFHCYDLDFSLQITKYYKIAVVFDILIEHFSEGSINRSFYDDLIGVHKKFRNYLPLNKLLPNNKNFYFHDITTMIEGYGIARKISVPLRTLFFYDIFNISYYFFPIHQLKYFILFIIQKAMNKILTVKHMLLFRKKS